MEDKFEEWKCYLTTVFDELFNDFRKNVRKKILVTYPAVFWAYHYLRNKWSSGDYDAPSSSMLKC